MPKPNFRMSAKGTTAEIVLYEEIDAVWGVGAKRFREELQALGQVDTIHMRLASNGGEIFEGLAIYNTLKSHPARVIVHVDGIAASMASVVAMAGDEIEIAENGWMMIHDPAGVVVGDSDEMRQTADLLDRLKTTLVDTYAKRTGQDSAKIAQLMLEETWLDAKEAVTLGFADRVGAPMQLAASIDPKRYSKIPTQLLNRSKEKEMSEDSKTPAAPQAATYHDLKAAFPKASAEFLTAQLDRNATMPQAQDAYRDMLEKRAADAEAKAEAAEKAKAEAEAKVTNKKPGVPPVADGGKPADDGGTGDPIDDFNAAVSALVAKGMTRSKATAKVCRENKEMHEAYVAAWNQRHKNARGQA